MGMNFTFDRYFAGGSRSIRGTSRKIPAPKARDRSYRRRDRRVLAAKDGDVQRVFTDLTNRKPSPATRRTKRWMAAIS